MTRRIAPGEVINLYALDGDLPNDATLALIKTPDMEVIRMVLPGGKEVEEHNVDGEISIQCIQGKIRLTTGANNHELSKGDWLYLERNQPHSMKVISDTVLLVTILFVNNS